MSKRENSKAKRHVAQYYDSKNPITKAILSRLDEPEESSRPSHVTEVSLGAILNPKGRGYTGSAEH